MLLDRGVHIAPWLGARGEIVLLSVTAGHMLLHEPRLIPRGSDHVEAADELWDELEARDNVDGPAHTEPTQRCLWIMPDCGAASSPVAS